MGLSYRKRHNVICAECGNKFEVKSNRFKKSKSGLFFCCRECKDNVLNFSLAKVTYSKRAFKHKVNKCEDCGEERRYLLIVHHKDGNNKNNNLKNLEIVCNNCHTKRHLYFKNGRWRYNTTSLTPRDLLNEL
jgi:hypothetical protein